MGSAITRANVGGRVYAKFVSAAGVGNATGTSDSALWTLTPIPAGTLSVNGDTVEITFSFVTGSNANNKRVGVTVGGTQVSTGNSGVSGITFNGRVTITRVGATSVNVSVSAVGQGAVISGGSVGVAVSSLATNTLAIVLTGASPTTGAANDVVLYSGIAELK